MPSAQKLSYRNGIYCICNIMNGKMYIGSTYTSFSRRWSEHRRFLRKGRHHSKSLQEAWNFFGGSPFTFAILEDCERKLCQAREQAWMDMLHPEYNVCKKACCPSRGHGYRHTEETKRKMSTSATGRHHSPSAILKIKAARALQGPTFLGRKHTPETLEKLSKRFRGTKWDTEKRGPHYQIGRMASEDTKKRMSMSAVLGWEKRRAKTCK